MITVPVFVGFDQNEQIGHLTVDETKLPKEADYCFSLAHKLNVDEPGREIVCVALVSDQDYRKFLNEQKPLDI